MGPARVHRGKCKGNPLGSRRGLVGTSVRNTVKKRAAGSTGLAATRFLGRGIGIGKKTLTARPFSVDGEGTVLAARRKN